MPYPFRQVDVFTTEPYLGNPVAVVLDGDGITAEQMQRVAHWTNLSETTFVLSPTQPGADYRVRIFTPSEELPFAGHPTLGTCHAWLSGGGVPASGGDVIVQECAAGLVSVRRTPEGLAFAAPPVVRDGPVEEALLAEVVAGLGISRSEVVDAQWADNGPPWIAVLLASADEVLALPQAPALGELYVGAAGPHAAGGPADLEVRAFFPHGGATVEDPVTGSLNASLAQWMMGARRIEAPYVARQGTALGRDGRVHVTVDAAGVVWVAGGTVTCVTGEIEI